MNEPVNNEAIKERLKELKRKKLELLKQQAAYQQDNLIEFFNNPERPLMDGRLLVPNPKQAQLLEAFKNPRYRVFTYTGANRCGKTTIWAIIAICCMAGKWLWNGEPIRFSHNKPRKIRVVGQGWSSHIKTVVVPELWKWWPKNRPMVGGKPKKNNDGVEYFWEDAITGSTLEILSNKQESEMFEGWSGDACIEERQRVWMGDSTWKRIKDVKVGDEVWTVGNSGLMSKNKVTHVIDNGVRDIVQVSVDGWYSLFCTPDHKIYVSGLEKKEAQHLKRGDAVCCEGVEYWSFDSVRPAGKARVYDLTVENNHNFICEGILVSNCIFDEPPRRDIRVAAARGLIDRGGFELYACTLLKEAWVAQEIIKARLPDGRPDPSVYNVHATIEDNIGYGITRENVDQFAKMLTEDEKDARLRGVPSYMSGLVYPQFARDIHLKKRFRVPLDWPVDIAIDTHPRKPHSVLFMATSPRGFKYCIHEIREHGDGKSIAESVVRLVQWGVYRVNKVIIDPLSKGDSNETDTTFEKASDVFARHGMYLETASKNKDAGILSVKEYLKSENNEASLFFFDDLVYTIKEIEGLMWEVDPNSEKEKAQKVDDDMMEDLYRLILLGTEYTRAIEAEEDEVPVVSGVNKVTGY